ncbi:MAG: hypothetical protein HFH59_08385 [Lachnospiraceae bacterium]|jgi:hypothetical protein|nr:hypothetical protein [Lachnospiraceae bacterium]MCI9357546.1 hypothetical protein [Lachnospiraceae bacterium]
MIGSTSTKPMSGGLRDKERHVVFLDIDGVLQPCSSQKRFDHNLIQTRADIAEKMGDSRYLELDKYDVAAVYYDWHKKAVENLRRLLEECGAEIVISSDWKRSKSLEQLKLLFGIHGLDSYITGMVPYDFHTLKKDEIGAYLEAHPGLNSYVVLDDLNMEKYFRGHMVCTGYASFLTEDAVRKAARILEFGPWWEELYHQKTSPEIIGSAARIKDHYKKVIFLDVDGVLNDDGPERNDQGIVIDQGYIRNLNKIIEKTGAEVVLSSSWRYSYGKYARQGFHGDDENVEIFLKRLDMYDIQIPGITPYLFNGHDMRPFEIASWLSRRPEVENFVILDDETFWDWKWLKPHVVCTSKERKYQKGSFVKGLDERCAQMAVELLKS